MKSVDKCVVILSGGPDSTTTAYWAKNQGYDVHALTFNYGQIAKREIDSARMITERLGITHKVIDFSSLEDIYVGVTSLVDKNIPMTGEFSDPIVVPFRNGVFIAAAVAYAASVGASKILYGAHGSDETFYPDCRREFYKAFEEAARLGTELEITIESPFSEISKSEIIRRGYGFGVPFHLTWSCYLNGPKHCGSCESCINRREAFKEAGLSDPTEYLK